MKLENCFGKRKANSLSLPLFLSFGLLAHLSLAGPLAHLPFLPLLPFLFLGRPNSNRATVAALLTLSAADRLAPLVGAVAHLLRRARSRRNLRCHARPSRRGSVPAPQPL